MDWFKPKDATAKEFMASEALVNADAPTATRLSEIDTQRMELQQQLDQVASTPALDQETLRAQLDIIGELQDQLKTLDTEASVLTKEYNDKGYTSR